MSRPIGVFLSSSSVPVTSLGFPKVTGCALPQNGIPRRDAGQLRSARHRALRDTRRNPVLDLPLNSQHERRSPVSVLTSKAGVHDCAGPRERCPGTQPAQIRQQRAVIGDHERPVVKPVPHLAVAAILAHSALLEQFAADALIGEVSTHTLACVLVYSDLRVVFLREFYDTIEQIGLYLRELQDRADLPDSQPVNVGTNQPATVGWVTPNDGHTNQA